MLMCKTLSRFPCEWWTVNYGFGKIMCWIGGKTGFFPHNPFRIPIPKPTVCTLTKVISAQLEFPTHSDDSLQMARASMQLDEKRIVKGQ